MQEHEHDRQPEQTDAPKWHSDVAVGPPRADLRRISASKARIWALRCAFRRRSIRDTARDHHLAMVDLESEGFQVVGTQMVTRLAGRSC